jgi:hypothetical protein
MHDRRWRREGSRTSDGAAVAPVFIINAFAVDLIPRGTSGPCLTEGVRWKERDGAL